MKLTKSQLKEMIKEELFKEEHTITFSKEEMGKLHNDGKIEKDGHFYVFKEELQKEDFGSSAKQMPKFSSKEAKTIVDSSLRDWAKVLRKAKGQVVKDWMSMAKAGKLDYFDLVRGLQWGDSSRANPDETKFLFSLLTKDKIINRFKSYFGGKKAMNNRLKKKDYYKFK